MAWPEAALAALAAGKRIRFEIEVWEVAVGTTPGTPTLIDQEELGTLETTARTLQPSTWRAELGGFRFTLLPQSNATLLLSLVRGQPVTLWGTVGGERIRLEVGRVYQVRRGLTRGALIVECLDLFSSLSSRFSALAVADLPLFSDVEVASAITDLASAYTVGDPTLTVTDASGFDKDSEGGKYGALRVTPSSGEVFYLRWSALSTNTFTLDTALTFGTTPVNSAIGDEVKHVALISDHPMDVVRKIVVSQGGGGAYDTLPVDWGYALPEALLDHGDIGQHKALLNAGVTGTYAWQVLADALVENGYDWLNDELSNAGLFVGQRQGQITVRAVRSPWGDSLASGYTITDDDIGRIELHDLYDTQNPVVSGGIRVTSTTSVRESRGTSVIDSLPGREWNERTLQYTWSNEAETVDEVIDRLIALEMRAPERIRLRCLGLRLAGLALGDTVLLTSRYLEGRAGGVYTERPCMVVGQAVEWLRGAVTLELLSWPEP